MNKTFKESSGPILGEIQALACLEVHYLWPEGSNVPFTVPSGESWWSRRIRQREFSYSSYQDCKRRYSLILDAATDYSNQYTIYFRSRWGAYAYLNKIIHILIGGHQIKSWESAAILIAQEHKSRIWHANTEDVII
jgi:hypothetical protein